MKTLQYSDIVTPELMRGALLNNEFQGFREDYAVLHCLLRKIDKGLKESFITKSDT